MFLLSRYPLRTACIFITCVAGALSSRIVSNSYTCLFIHVAGLAVRDYWKVDDSTVVFVADPTFGDILNFNVGQAVDLEVPRVSLKLVETSMCGRYQNWQYSACKLLCQWHSAPQAPLTFAVLLQPRVSVIQLHPAAAASMYCVETARASRFMIRSSTTIRSRPSCRRRTSDYCASSPLPTWFTEAHDVSINR